MRSSRGERAAPRGATHAGLGLELDGRWEAEAASTEWRRRRQRSGVDAPAPTRPEGPGLTPALALLRRRHLRPHGPRSGKVDAPGGPSRRAHLLPCAPAPPPPRPPSGEGFLRDEGAQGKGEGVAHWEQGSGLHSSPSDSDSSPVAASTLPKSSVYPNFLAAKSRVDPSHVQPFSRAQRRTFSWPPWAAAAHVSKSHGHPETRSH